MNKSEDEPHLVFFGPPRVGLYRRGKWEMWESDGVHGWRPYTPDPPVGESHEAE